MTPARRRSVDTRDAAPDHDRDATAGEARIVVRVTPRGGRDAIDGVGPEGELLVRVRAAPVEGGANRAVLHLLADALRVPATAVELEAGEGSRTKRIRVPSDAAARLRDAWPGVVVSDVHGRGRAR